MEIHFHTVPSLNSVKLWRNYERCFCRRYKLAINDRSDCVLCQVAPSSARWLQSFAPQRNAKFEFISSFKASWGITVHQHSSTYRQHHQRKRCVRHKRQNNIQTLASSGFIIERDKTYVFTGLTSKRTRELNTTENVFLEALRPLKVTINRLIIIAEIQRCILFSFCLMLVHFHQQRLIDALLSTIFHTFLRVVGVGPYTLLPWHFSRVNVYTLTACNKKKILF